MADQLILQVLGTSEDAGRILDEFEQRTGLEADVLDGARIYALHGEQQHREKIVQTLTDIDPDWTDHIGFKLPG